MATRSYKIIRAVAEIGVVDVECTQDAAKVTVSVPVPAKLGDLHKAILAAWPTDQFAKLATDLSSIALDQTVTLTADDIPYLNAIITDPPPTVIPKLTIVDRLNAAGKLGAALAAMAADPVLKARWDAAVLIHPDDPAVLAFLQAIGADAAVVLAAGA